MLFRSPLLEVEADAAGAGVDGVFEEFLDDRGWPLDDFTRGDLVGDQRGEDADGPRWGVLACGRGHGGWYGVGLGRLA